MIYRPFHRPGCQYQYDRANYEGLGTTSGCPCIQTSVATSLPVSEAITTSAKYARALSISGYRACSPWFGSLITIYAVGTQSPGTLQRQCNTTTGRFTVCATDSSSAQSAQSTSSAVSLAQQPLADSVHDIVNWHMYICMHNRLVYLALMHRAPFVRREARSRNFMSCHRELHHTQHPRQCRSFGQVAACSLLHLGASSRRALCLLLRWGMHLRPTVLLLKPQGNHNVHKIACHRTWTHPFQSFSPFCKGHAVPACWLGRGSLRKCIDCSHLSKSRLWYHICSIDFTPWQQACA